MGLVEILYRRIGLKGWCLAAELGLFRRLWHSPVERLLARSLAGGWGEVWNRLWSWFWNDGSRRWWGRIPLRWLFRLACDLQAIVKIIEPFPCQGTSARGCARRSRGWRLSSQRFGLLGALFKLFGNGLIRRRITGGSGQDALRDRRIIFGIGRVEIRERLRAQIGLRDRRCLRRLRHSRHNSRLRRHRCWRRICYSGRGHRNGIRLNRSR